MISAIIFDMDGLLVDSEVYWEDARRAYAESQGCGWTPKDELDAKGLNSLEWAALIQERCGLETDRDAIIHGVAERMMRLYQERLPLLLGATAAVRSLAASYPLGLASSSPPWLIEYVLTQAGIRPCFSAIVSADEVGKGKPSPDVFLVTAQRLGAVPREIVVFEDSSAGIRAGKAAGMYVIAVPNPHYPPGDEVLRQADVVVKSLEDFRPEMLRSL